MSLPGPACRAALGRDLGTAPSLPSRTGGLRRRPRAWGCPPVYPLGRMVCAARPGVGGCPPIYPSGRMYRKNHTAQATVMSMAFGVSACGWTKPRPSDLTGPPDRKNGRRQAGGWGCPPMYRPGRVGGTKNIPQPRKRNITLRGTHGVAIRLGFLAPVSRFLRLSAPRAQRTPASPASARAPQASPGYPLPPRAPGGRYERSSLAACPARPR